MKDEYCGYYTVEAAMLMPILLTCILLIIYMSFYVHDKCVLDCVCYEAALRGAMVTDPEADPVKKAEDAARELLDKRMIVSKNVEIDAKATALEISVSGKADFRIPKGIVLIPELRRKGISISADKKYSSVQPIEVVRALRAGKNIIDMVRSRSGVQE